MSAGSQQAPVVDGEGRLRYRVRNVPGLPIVAVRVWLPGGSLTEGIPGLATITGRLLSEGSESRDWRQIAEETEDLGMALSSFGGLEAHGLAVDALAGNWEEALETASELLFESRFPEERCDWLRRQAMAELESLGDQPDVRTAWSFFHQLYHPHPAGRPLLGTPSGLSRLRAADCREFHRCALERGCLVTVAGEIDEERVGRRIEQLWSRLREGRAVTFETADPRGSGEARKTVPLPPNEATQQAHLYLGHLTVGRRHPDYRALQLAGVVLGAGSGLAGRIPTRVREVEGLAYSAQASVVSGAGLTAGRLVIYVGTAPDRVERAEVAVREELDRLLEEGLSEGEVADARAYLLGREPFLRETARQWSDLLAEALFYDQPVDRSSWVRRQLLELDRPTVEEALRRHLDPTNLRLTVGLPAERAQAEVSPAAGL